VKEEGNSIKSMIEESGFDPREFVEVEEALATLRTVVPTDAPPPSVELAALLSGTTLVRVPVQTPQRSKVALVSGAMAAVLTFGTGVAAAANTLPEPAQRFFSEVSDKYLPFHIPSPDEREDYGAPVEPGIGKPVDQTDNGKHIGGGAGLGKTDNLGKQLGTPGAQPSAQPSAGNPSPGDPQGDDNANGGEGVGEGDGAGQTDNPGIATPTAKPWKAPTQPPAPSEPPRAQPVTPTPTPGKKKPPKEDDGTSSSEEARADQGKPDE
jgi:hypothetical protein